MGSVVRVHPDPHEERTKFWGISLVGRAPALQAGGQRFESAILHQSFVPRHVAQMGERYLDKVEVGGSIPPVPRSVVLCWEVFIAKEQSFDKRRINQQIRAQSVKLIDDEGVAHGEIPFAKALEMALEKHLDLVEMSSQQDPPICKIMNYGKFKYQETKKLHALKLKQKQVTIKELKFRPKIEEHDLEVKLTQIKEFLEEGHKVKVTMRFFGREIQHAFIGEEVLKQVVKALEGFAEIESRSQADLRSQMIVFAPLKKK